MDLAVWEMAVLILAGLAGGFINVMAGGGSVITVPVMIFLGIPGPIANGTNRLPIMVQNISASLTYMRHGIPQKKLIVSLSLCALPGVSIPTDTFNFVLAGVMALVLIAMVVGPHSVSMNDAAHLSKSRKILGHVLMLGAGFWGGFIQIGMGFILLPILHRALGLDLVTANIHKVFIILIYTTAALFVFGSQLPLLWWVGGIMAIGNAVGGWLGARLTLTGGARVIRIIVVLAVAGMIVKLIWFT
jgi:uncharacterized membrane protein YfcA